MVVEQYGCALNTFRVGDLFFTLMVVSHVKQPHYSGSTECFNTPRVELRILKIYEGQQQGWHVYAGRFTTTIDSS